MRRYVLLTIAVVLSGSTVSRSQEEVANPSTNGSLTARASATDPIDKGCDQGKTKRPETGGANNPPQKPNPATDAGNKISFDWQYGKWQVHIETETMDTANRKAFVFDLLDKLMKEMPKQAAAQQAHKASGEKEIMALGLLLREHPFDADLYCQRGQLYLCEQKWKAAEQDFSDAIRFAPNHPLAILGWADAAREHADLMNRDTANVGGTTGASQKAPSSALSDADEASNTSVDSAYDEAIHRYAHIIETHPRYAPGYLNRGKAYEAQWKLGLPTRGIRQLQNALADYAMASRLDPLCDEARSLYEQLTKLLESRS